LQEFCKPGDLRRGAKAVSANQLAIELSRDASRSQRRPDSRSDDWRRCRSGWRTACKSREIERDRPAPPLSEAGRPRWFGSIL